MWWNLEQEIQDAARKKIADFERLRKRNVDEFARRQRRSSVPIAREPVKKPATWESHRGHDPYRVYYRAKRIAHALEGSLRNGTYEPLPPVPVPIAKADGELREVSSFAIADEVMSRRLYNVLLEKNRSLLSARSYAYRADITALDALAYVQANWRNEQRLFVAEYDFSNFFDSISHDHIWSEIESMGLRVTTLERRLIRAFLEAPLPVRSPVSPVSYRTRGVAQGTSASLLLANIAANSLDRELEGLGVRFVRYADDTLIWSRDYSEICRAVDSLHRSAAAMGVPINPHKSSGVRLLTRPEVDVAELPHIRSVTYLSHELGLTQTALKDDLVKKFKAEVERLAFNELIRMPKAGTQDLGRIGATDRDYVSLIWQLRRLYYGHTAENAMRRWSEGPLPRISLGGFFAQYPFVDAPAAYRELDRWALNQVWLALKKRQSLLSPIVTSTPTPWGLSKNDLLDLKVTSARTGDVVDLRFPNAERARRLTRRAVETHGTRVIGRTRASSLYGKA